MTEEVTKAMRDAGRDTANKGLQWQELWADYAERFYPAMRSASNSPTTNGEAARIPAAPDDVVGRFIARHVTLRDGNVVETTTPRICDWQSLISALAAIPIPAPTEERGKRAKRLRSPDKPGPHSHDTPLSWSDCL